MLFSGWDRGRIAPPRAGVWIEGNYSLMLLDGMVIPSLYSNFARPKLKGQTSYKTVNMKRKPSH